MRSLSCIESYYYYYRIAIIIDRLLIIGKGKRRARSNKQ